MKGLYGLVVFYLMFLFACSEKEKTNGGGLTFDDPPVAVMPDSGLWEVDMQRLYALRDSNRVWYDRSKEQGEYQQMELPGFLRFMRDWYASREYDRLGVYEKHPYDKEDAVLFSELNRQKEWRKGVVIQGTPAVFF